MKLPQFVTTFSLNCNKTKLPQFVTQACPISNTYIILLLSSVALTVTFAVWGEDISFNQSRAHRSCDHVICEKNALFPPRLTLATGYLVNLEKTAEMSPIKGEFSASYLKQIF